MFGRIDGIVSHADTRGSGQRFVQEAQPQTFDGPEQFGQFVFTAALEAMARQPEVISKLMTNMIIAAALIEGVALFAAVIAFMCL